VCNIKRCPQCKRSKNRAISEQASLRLPCDNLNCVFRDEIIKAIEHRSKIMIIKKELKVVKVEKKTIIKWVKK